MPTETLLAAILWSTLIGGCAWFFIKTLREP